MATQNTQSGMLGDLVRFSSALEENTGDLPTMGSAVAAFQESVTATQEAAMRQAALLAASREATREFQDLLRESGRLATSLRGQVKHRYGISSHAPLFLSFLPPPGRRSARTADIRPFSAISPYIFRPKLRGGSAGLESAPSPS